jgi:hypothetical protein
MDSKVPLNVCHTLVEYVLSPHATNGPPSNNTANTANMDSNSGSNNKDERYSALDVCALLNALHEKCHGLLQKFSSVNMNGKEEEEDVVVSKSSSITAWSDIWKPILISLARCTSSSHSNVVHRVMMYLKNALLSEQHGVWLSGSQWIQVHEELIFPLVTSICQTNAAAKAQAALGSPLKDTATITTTSSSHKGAADGDVGTNSRLALNMLIQVLVQSSSVMKEDDKDHYLQIWTTAVRTIMDFATDDKTRGVEDANVVSSNVVVFIHDMVSSMHQQEMYDDELKTLTKSIIGFQQYELIMSQKVPPQGGEEEEEGEGEGKGEDNRMAKAGAPTSVGDSRVDGREVKESTPPL